MGRMLVMVPPNWSHPRIIHQNGEEGFQPILNRSFEEVASKWEQECRKWEAGERPDYCPEECKSMRYSDWAGDRPNPKYYRPWKEEEATWYQLWENVSDGTPVTPPFPTKGQLIEYLVENGDFWDQARRREGVTGMDCDPWSREAAETMVNDGYRPMLIITPSGEALKPRDARPHGEQGENNVEE